MTPELVQKATAAIDEIVASRKTGIGRETAIALVNQAIKYIGDHEMRVKRRSSLDTEEKRAERKRSYLNLFAFREVSPGTAQQIVDLAMQ